MLKRSESAFAVVITAEFLCSISQVCGVNSFTPASSIPHDDCLARHLTFHRLNLVPLHHKSKIGEYDG